MARCTGTRAGLTDVSRIRRYFFNFILIGLMIGFVEACSALAYWSGLVLPEKIYRSDFFLCRGCKTMADAPSRAPGNTYLGWDYYDPDIGWDNYVTGRRESPALDQLCGAAFGDSYTQGEEVNASQSWPFVLSNLMGCEIENFGVGGFGQDQAYLKYLKYRPAGHIVIIGLFEEMLRRNFAASWQFYAGLPNSLPKPFFRLSATGLNVETAPRRLDPALIKAHHKFDRYADPYRVEFPYAPSLIRIIYYRLFPTAFAKNRLEPHDSAWTDPDSTKLSLEILSSFIKAAEADRKTPIVLLFPTPDEVAEDRRSYASFLTLIRGRWPSTCVVDPFDVLRERYRKGEGLRAPNGHFNDSGNEAIATAVFQAIRTCHDGRRGCPP